MSLSTVRWLRVATFRSVTLAPTTAAAPGSVIVPVSVAVSDCAKATPARTVKSRIFFVMLLRLPLITDRYPSHTNPPNQLPRLHLVRLVEENKVLGDIPDLIGQEIAASESFGRLPRKMSYKLVGAYSVIYA